MKAKNKSESEYLLSNGLKIYSYLKNKRILTQSYVNNDMKYEIMDDNDKKVISLFIAFFETSNKAGDYLKTRGLTREIPMNYLGLDVDLNFKSTKENTDDKVEYAYFIETLKGSSIKITPIKLLSTLYNNYLCGSNIIENMYFSEISRETKFFESDREAIEQIMSDEALGNVNIVNMREKFEFQITL